MTQAQSIQADTDLEVNRVSFRRSLRAANKSPMTVKCYVGAVSLFESFLRDKGMPQLVANIRREHVETFIADQLEKWTPGTANNRYRALQAWFKWLREEGEIGESPMANTKPPKLEQVVIPVLTEDEVGALFDACKGRGFEARRDLAMIRVMACAGTRRAETAALRYAPEDPLTNDLDLDVGRLRVRGKGGRERYVGLDDRTVLALDRYLRLRDGRKDRDSGALWLGLRGPMTADGVRQMLRRRVVQAGITKRVSPHVLRHTFAHFWMADGGSETDLMHTAGWRSRQMLSRYAASAAAERAVAASKKVGLGNRI